MFTMHKQKLNSVTFYEMYMSYVNNLLDNGVAKQEIFENVQAPFSAQVPAEHRQIYLNLQSMLCRDPLTAMAATGLYNFNLKELKDVQDKCINELVSAKRSSLGL